jgi:hypothetical protein
VPSAGMNPVRDRAAVAPARICSSGRRPGSRPPARRRAGRTGRRGWRRPSRGRPDRSSAGIGRRPPWRAAGPGPGRRRYADGLPLVLGARLRCVLPHNTGQRPGPLDVNGAVPQTALILLLTRRYSSVLLNFATHSPEDSDNTTENSVLRASSGPARRDCSSTERRVGERLSTELGAVDRPGRPRLWSNVPVADPYIYTSALRVKSSASATIRAPVGRLRSR